MKQFILYRVAARGDLSLFTGEIKGSVPLFHLHVPTVDGRHPHSDQTSVDYTNTGSFGFSCKHVLPNASGVGTSLCLLMVQKVPGPACEERRAPGRVLICWGTHRDAFLSSFPSSSIPPSFIWAPAQRWLAPCQRLIINFHQHRESKMDSLASCVVTLGMGVNGLAQEETDCVCVWGTVRACVCLCMSNNLLTKLHVTCLWETYEQQLRDR